MLANVIPLLPLQNYHYANFFPCFWDLSSPPPPPSKKVYALHVFPPVSPPVSPVETIADTEEYVAQSVTDVPVVPSPTSPLSTSRDVISVNAAIQPPTS